MTNHKSILICAASFPPEKGGAPTRIYNLAALLRDAGYRVTVITSMPNYPAGSIFPGYRGRLICKETVEGIRVVRLWLIPSHSGSLVLRGASLVSQLASLALMAFPRLLFRKATAVIISSPPLVTAWATALMARISAKKVLVNVSDIWPLTATEMGALKGGLLLRLLQAMERQLYALATAFTGQSNEILDHIRMHSSGRRQSFLYRNLQAPLPAGSEPTQAPPSRPACILYAGNLGHAQGMLELCRNLDFHAAGATLHIYGDGAERTAIAAHIAQHPGCGIVLHRTIPQPELNRLLPGYTAVLIPLKMHIRGAVPSKLFMAVANGLPVLFCGGGEGEQLVQAHGLGWTSAPGDYAALQQHITALGAMPSDDYEHLEARIRTARESIFSKAVQDRAFLQFLADFCSAGSGK